MKHMRAHLLRLYRYFFVMPLRGVIYDAYRHRVPSLKPRPPLPHPIDSHYGIDTGGSEFGASLNSGRLSADAYITGYAGSQPSSLRKIFALFPHLEDTTFLDLGCGKGRALAVASEFPFGAIVGVELSPKIAAIARANAHVMHSRFPSRTPIAVVEGDASQFLLPEGRVIVFIYNPFYRHLMKKLAMRLQETLFANPKKKIFVVYANPLYADLFDRSPLFHRFFAADLPYDASEEGTGTTRDDKDDTYVIWESLSPAMLPPHAGADAPVIITEAGWRSRVSKPNA